MKYGVVISAGTVHDYVTMARDAEANGWDGTHGLTIVPWPDRRAGTGSSPSTTRPAAVSTTLFHRPRCPRSKSG